MPFEQLGRRRRIRRGYRVDVDIAVMSGLRGSHDKLELSHEVALIGEDEASRSRTTYVTLSRVPVQ